jgi:hypothetical protein
MLSSVLGDFHILILFCEISLCIFTAVSIMLMRNSKLNFLTEDQTPMLVTDLCQNREFILDK